MYIIGKLDANGNVFTNGRPHKHSTAADAFAEQDRLAKANPGEIFVVFGSFPVGGLKYRVEHVKELINVD